MKRAVVLCGGGTKGSYELGVWKAMREVGIEYHIVTGTSIGSINGALMVQKDYEAAAGLWDTLVIDDVMADGINLSETIEGFYNQKGKLKPFLKKYVRNKGADISPYNKLVEGLIDEKKFFESEIDYGLVTVQFPSLEPVEMTKRQLEPGMLKDYIIASSSIFPAFPMHKIGDQTYLDGCYYDNMPVDLAIRLGADEIIAVDLHDQPSHPKFVNRPFVTYISPTRHLGSMLDFDKNVLARNKQMGYYDAMKVFGRYLGFRYTFEKNGIRDFEKQIERYMRSVMLIDSQDTKTVLAAHLSASEKRTVYDLLEAGAGESRRAESREDYFLLGLELAGEIFGMDKEPVYELSDFAGKLTGMIEDESSEAGMELIEVKGIADTVARFMEIKPKRDGRSVAASIYRAIREGKANDLQRHGIYVVFQKELLAALALLSLKTEPEGDKRISLSNNLSKGGDDGLRPS